MGGVGGVAVPHPARASAATASPAATSCLFMRMRRHAAAARFRRDRNVMNCDHRVMPDRTMTWAEVAGRLSKARTYWLGTTTPSGAPHAAPVWGAVTGQTLYLYSERSTVKARNLAIDPRVVVHLESGEDVLIVHGAAEDLGPPAEVPSVVAALAAKYTRPEDRQYLPDADPAFDVVYAVRPRSAIAWRLDDYADSQRRWSF